MQLKTKIIPLLSSFIIDIVLGVPKATLRLNDSLERPTGLRKALILTVMVYYHKRIQIRVSTEGKSMG